LTAAHAIRWDASSWRGSPGMGGKGMIECSAIDVLRMGRQIAADRLWKVGIARIRL
jgi:hypothetical protein